MAAKDLIFLKGNDDPRSVAIRAKLKGSGSPKRKLAQKINSIPLMKQETFDREIMELVSNPEASAKQIQTLIKQAMARDLKDSDFIQLIRTVIAKHSALFGTKVEASIKSDKGYERYVNSVKDRLETKYDIVFADKPEENKIGVDC